MYMYVYIVHCTYMHAHTHIYMYTHTHTHTHTRAHTLAHTHTHTRTHTHTHTPLSIPTDPSPELVELLDEAAGDHAHYSDDDDYSDRQKSSILDLLNSLSPREAPVIPGCSETKAALLLARKPFLSWGHLVSYTCTCRYPPQQRLVL